MRTKVSRVLTGLLTLVFFTMDGDSYGQRGGRGGGFRGGSISGGHVVGPYGGYGGGVRTTGTVIGPTGRTTTGGADRGSYTTARGTSINYGGAGVRTTGPGGVTAGRGVGGVQVTTPGGQTATRVGTAGGVRGPGGNAIGTRSSIATTTGPRGSAASFSHGGIAIGPGGTAVGGARVGVATGPRGTVVRGSQVGVASGPYGLSRYASRGVAVSNRTYHVSASTLPVYGAQVRGSFVHYRCFTPTWYRAHPTAWWPRAWTGPVFWRGVAWGTLATTCGYAVRPAIYDYGTTVVYEDNNVYYNGEMVGTAEQYALQATDIATKAQDFKPAENEEWVPLGVFGMVQGEEKDANNIFQLAINKDGVLRGNYYNALSDTTVPVSGFVDRTTQRAAWTVRDRKDTVYETGIGNLTQPQTTMLVHFGKDRTQQWTLVRLDPPPADGMK